MYNPYTTSTISLRTRGTASFGFSDYAHCPIERSPCSYSSSAACCCCCAESICKVPVGSTYCYNLYGLRQSSLIQWSPYRRLVSGGLDRFHSACFPPLNDVDFRCYRGEVLSSRKTRLVGRKMGLGKCMVYEERSERSYGIGGVDEAEILLSLLAEDVSEDCLVATKLSRRVVKKKKPVAEEIENGKVRSKKERDGQDGLESESRYEHGGSAVVSSGKIGKNGQEVRRERSKEKHDDGLLRNRGARRKEESVGLMSKMGKKDNEHKERKAKLREENWKVTSGVEEREELVRREERKQNLRKEGSSCSSYYSFSSTGDYESDNDVDLRGERYSGEFSGREKRDSKSNAIVYKVARKEEKDGQEDYRGDHGFVSTKKSSQNVGLVGSSVVELGLRKRSEKKLADVSVEEFDSREETSQKESKLSSNKSLDYYVSYDDRQTGNEVSRQSETRMKHKQFADMQEFHGEDLTNSYSSQKIYRGEEEKSSKVASSSQETVEDLRRTVGNSSKEDIYQRNSVLKVSEVEDIDIRKTLISRKRIETDVKEEEHSTNIHSSINDAAKKKCYDQVTTMVDSGGRTQELTKKEGKSILKKVSDKHIQEKNMRDDSNKGYDVLSKVSIIHSGDSGEINKQGRSKSKSEIQVGVGALTNDTIAIAEVTDEGLQIVSNLPHLQELEVSPGLHQETCGEASSSATHRLPSKLDSTIGSAARLEKSSTQYIGEFINQVRDEISSSEIQKEHESRSDSQQSGTKGPSDEIWTVEEPSVQEASKTEDEDDASKAVKGVDKRSGRSLWNLISDIVLLRWSSRAESHGSGKKTGRSSPTSSEAWFSGHEATEIEETSEEKEQKGVTPSLPSGIDLEEKSHPRADEASRPSAFGSHLKHGVINVSPSSTAQELRPTRSSLHFGVMSEGISTTTTAESSIPLPTFRQQISPIALGVASEGGKESDNGSREKQNTRLKMTTESAGDEGESRRKQFQRLDQVMKDRFDDWENAYRLEEEQRKTDEKFMWEALMEAQNAADNWEVPVGAVLVHDGKIIARGYNKVEELRDSTAHAEMICIREASNILRTWRLSETTLYITLEPCPMCAGAILQARVDTVVWGAPNKLLGADGSWIRLFPSGDGGNGLELSEKPPAPVHPFHPKIVIRRGVLASECAEAMQQFFRLRRKKDKKPDSSAPPPAGPPPGGPHRPLKFLAKMQDAFNLMFCL
ncbi:tRNA(adenine(34)) deaminase, chloroplastic [Andrographis paniculata]|uniref:tRNA(adenine(34)) deaminase, chloroplastic n=1 Tax=Andrographis paniculata TaxID=175694 RepID=UPI0021E93F3B|nr:tRNA(adenine(34)) deaminase, chloroplastic [Andrographis paniculata]